jgi:TonB family protein
MTSILLGGFAAGAIVFAIAILLCRTLLRRSSAAVRHLTLATAFAAALIAPMVLPLVPRVAPVQTLRASIVMVVGSGEAQQASEAVAETTRIDWTVVMLWVWSLGAALTLARLYTAIRYRSQYSEPAAQVLAERGTALARELGIHRAVRFRQSDAAVVAETHGVLRPVVVLPVGASQWPADRLAVVLRHELTHVLRSDWLATAVAEVTAAIHWFNPLAFLALRELRREREIACDDDVLEQGMDGCDYADHLLGIVAGLRERPCAASVAMAQASHLETRIRSILDPRITRGGVTMLTRIGAGTLAAGFLIAFSAMQAPAQSGTAAISGTVLDASSARVPNASVVVRNTETKKLEIVRTNDTGEFSFAGLPTGTYTVEVMKAGFQLWRQENVAMPAGSAQNISVLLNLGRLTETVNVNGTRTSPAPAVAASGTAPKRLRIGGGVQAAKMVKQVRPMYPQHVKDAGIEGTVLLEGTIGRDGAIINLQPLNSQVHPDLTQAAVDAVSQWRWEPTYLNGEPVEIITAITINFTLSK